MPPDGRGRGEAGAPEAAGTQETTGGQRRRGDAADGTAPLQRLRLGRRARQSSAAACRGRDARRVAQCRRGEVVEVTQAATAATAGAAGAGGTPQCGVAVNAARLGLASTAGSRGPCCCGGLAGLGGRGGAAAQHSRPRRCSGRAVALACPRRWHPQGREAVHLRAAAGRRRVWRRRRGGGRHGGQRHRHTGGGRRGARSGCTGGADAGVRGGPAAHAAAGHPRRR